MVPESPLVSMVPRSARHTVVTTLTELAELIPIQRVSYWCASWPLLGAGVYSA